MDELHAAGAGDLSAQFEAQARRYAGRLARAWQDLVAQPTPAPEAVIDYLGWVGSHERLSPILTLWRGGFLTSATLNLVLAKWWNLVESLSQMSASTIVRLFTAAGFVTDRAGIARPTNPLTVYRGASLWEPRGVCWTTDPAKARWFADRFGTPGRTGRAVFSATVPPHGVLGRFFERNESEVVVNPRTLRGFRIESEG